MAMTGFNPDVVTTSINGVKNAYESLIGALGDNMQNDFVNGMSTVWACNEAIAFFRDAFKPTIDQLIVDSNTIFSSVVSSMNSAASNWAAQTQSSWSGITLSTIDKKIDISGIHENINGDRGIDTVEAQNVSNKLPMIAESAKNALTSAQNAVQSCGFLGGTQASTLAQSLTTIKNNIDSATQSITSATKNAIQKTVETYGSIETNVTSAFSGNN